MASARLWYGLRLYHFEISCNERRKPLARRIRRINNSLYGGCDVDTSTVDPRSVSSFTPSSSLSYYHT